MFSLAGKVTVVTGGASGIGEAAADRFEAVDGGAFAGYSIALLDALTAGPTGA